MDVILSVLWIGVAIYAVWEFANAKHMPAKYAKLKPQSIRWIDIFIIAMVILTVWRLFSS